MADYNMMTIYYAVAKVVLRLEFSPYKLIWQLHDRLNRLLTAVRERDCLVSDYCFRV